MSCKVSVRKSGDVAILDLEGRFTLADAAGVIRGAVQRLSDGGSRHILINLAGVNHMDSAAGLGELIGSYTLVSGRGGQLKLLHANKNVMDVLHVTRLDTVFEIHEDEEAAVRSFGQTAARGPN